jgi:hypothetical protein
MEAFSLLPPRTRHRIQVFLFGFLGAVCFAITIGPALNVMGYAYNPFDDVSNPLNGAFSKPDQFVGLFMIMYLGTAAIMLWANFIPSLAVLEFSPRVFHGILAFISSGLLIGMALFMYYLIEPQKTFIESNVTGTQDPIRAAVGVTLFIGFAFLLIITLSMMVNASPWGVMRRFREGAFAWAVTMRYRVTGALLLMVFLM